MSSRQRPYLFGILAAYVFVVAAGPAGAQTDARSPWLCTMPEVATMEGYLTKSPVFARTEQFGDAIYRIPTADGTGTFGWIVRHYRVDTAWRGSGKPATELLLFRPRRGSIPPVTAGVRLGPEEVFSSSNFLAAADWDQDGQVDLALSEELYDDTLRILGYPAVRAVVYWGRADGSFSTQDTSHLLQPIDSWGVVTKGASGRFNGAGTLDLVLWGGGYTTLDGVRHSTPRVHIYQGGGRWGRDGKSRQPVWEMWEFATPVFTNYWTRMQVLDADGDGSDDIAAILDTDGDRAIASIIYGRRGGLPDTSEAEAVGLMQAEGHFAQFEDLTGDGVPELAFTTGLTLMVRVYLGSRGQRLREQFGGGFQLADSTKPRGWARPWAEIPHPLKFSSGWTYYTSDLFPDLGDGNADGLPDLWYYSYPHVLRYDAGVYLDSLIDGMARIPPGRWREHGAVVDLGDIDSSGLKTLAIGHMSPDPARDGDRGRVSYYRMVSCNSARDVRRVIPEGLGPSLVVLEPDASTGAMVFPNPARDRVRVLVPDGYGAATIRLLDLLGRELRSWRLPAGSSGLDIDVSALPRGVYTIAVTRRRHPSSFLPLWLR